MTDSTSTDSAADGTEDDDSGTPEAETSKKSKKTKSKRSSMKETAILAVLAIGIYYVILTFVARPYLIPSESMEPTLHGCVGCVGDRIMVDKLTYRFSSPQPGDVIVFKGPESWNENYRSIRSDNTPVRWGQNTLSIVGFVPPDENDLVKRVIAVGGQKVECMKETGLGVTVDGKPLEQPFLDPEAMGLADPSQDPCLGSDFGPVTVPDGRLWVMGDNRKSSADSRAHCDTKSEERRPGGSLCTGDDANAGTVPVGNVIGKARFIAWPPSRWGGVSSVDIQPGQ